MTLLSIITINRNNANGLYKTIESVVNQTAFDQIEHIVIDGASTDGRKDIIEEYSGKLGYWISEPDKGIKVARGEYCQFLNSSDWLAENKVIEDLMNSFPEKCTIKYLNYAQYKA